MSSTVVNFVQTRSHSLQLDPSQQGKTLEEVLQQSKAERAQQRAAAQKTKGQVKSPLEIRVQVWKQGAYQLH